MLHRLAALALLLFALVGFHPGPARAQPAAVDLALVLAIDASYSVDRREFQQQVQGLARAFVSPRVIAAIEALPNRTISVAVTHWSKANAQVVSVPWTLIDGAPAALAFATRVADMTRRTADGATSISGAIRHAFRLLEQCPCQPQRRTVDVSGDGRNNNGPPLAPVRLEADARGVTVNGLAILNEISTLNFYYERRVVAGPAPFVEVAADYDDYARAIERKLLREIDAGVVQNPAGPDSRPRFTAFRCCSSSR